MEGSGLTGDLAERALPKGCYFVGGLGGSAMLTAWAQVQAAATMGCHPKAVLLHGCVAAAASGIRPCGDLW